ncbi:F-box/LRR-repeat protein 7-like isoform X2 [Littorina saxatilis]|uniref:F-box/LRR-repeat protein 7 n=1 Tax=Littorina saxatilis TaxID=31220 RepID=A0AAN9ASX8_9CAEN
MESRYRRRHRRYRDISPCRECQEKIKQRTDWNGVMQDLFGIDSPQTVESIHDSTSSGIVSDVVGYGPAQTQMSTFKGDNNNLHNTSHIYSTSSNGDHCCSDLQSQDSGNKTASSWASSPNPKASTPTPMSVQQQYQLGHSHRLSPASPMAYKSPSTPNHLHHHHHAELRHQRDAQMELLRSKMHYMDLQEAGNSNKPQRVTQHSSSSAGLVSKGKHPYTRPSPFEQLTDDIVLRVFSNLPTDHLCRCARVCRRWYHLVWDPTLWTSIVINNSIIDVDRALKYLTRRLSYNTPKVCVILERVNLNGCEQLTDKGLHTVAKRCPELRYLEVQGCTKLTNVGVFEAVSYCVNLEHLDVTGCTEITCIRLMSGVMTEGSAAHLQLIYLRYLDMTDCVNLQDAGLSLIAAHCMQLQFLFLRRCSQITDKGIQHVANSCYCLRELSISDCRGVTDLGLRELSKLGDNLRYLSVAKCDKVSDQGVKYIAKYCNKLRYLNVRGCEAVSDHSLDYLARHCPRLRSLDIGKCDITDEGLQVLAQCCPQLRKLSLKSCENVTDQGVVLVAYHCRGLQQLNIQDCHLTPDAYRTIKKYLRRCLIEHTNPGFC